MPESIIHRTFGGGFSLVRGPNDASIFQTTGGTPGACCCGGCPFYYMATLCNEACAPTSEHFYICSQAVCPVSGGFSGPIQPGKIIRWGGRCYRVGSTKYCPPGMPAMPISGGGEELCVPMPTRAPVYEFIGGDGVCENDCGPSICPEIGGYFELRKCSNNPFPTEPRRFMSCELYQHGLSLFPCPVYKESGCDCWYVVPGTQPVAELPPGAILYGNPFNIYRNCCACCGAAEPGCCRCTQESILNLIGCSLNQTIGLETCESWAQSGSAILYGAVKIEQLNTITGGMCPVRLDCYTPAGHNRYKLTSYPFNGECLGSVTRTCTGGGCNASLTGTPFGDTTEVEFDLGECATGFSMAQQVPGAGGTPPCCPNGQELITCRSYNANIVAGGFPDCIIRQTYCFNGQIEANSGTCGDDNCGESVRIRENPIVLLDGTPASDMNIVGGCSGCGGDKGELV